MTVIKRDDLYLEVATVPVSVVVDYRTWDWCAMPYPGHPHGCPNVGKGPACPPDAPHVEYVIDLTRTVWWVGQSYNLAEHARRMWQRHPNWSARQAYCLLYWQPSVRKKNRILTMRFLHEHPGTVAFSPEGLGVNVTRTLKSAGIKLRWKYPLPIVWKGCLVGYPLPGSRYHPCFWQP